MAVVGRPGHDPRLLEKAARPGRMRGIALDLLTRAEASPRAASGVLRRGLRDARALHSRERRLVADGLRGVIRDRAVLARGLGADDPEAAWLGWLVLAGLDPALARAQRSLPFDALNPTALLAGIADPIERLAVRASVGRAVAEELRRSLGAEVDAFVDASAGPAPGGPRVTPRRGTREQLLARLAAEGVEAVALVTAGAVRVAERAPLGGLRSFREGWFDVQDEGSQQVAARVPAGEVVVDLCAGAGGKTLALAARGPRRLIAVDVRERALRELGERAARAGAAVETVLWHEGALAGLEADVVLADVPCSGTGVWRRHPEGRLALTEAWLKELIAAQEEILGRGAGLVRPGGWLAYATCSVLRCENEDVIAAFLASHGSFTLVESHRWGPHLTGTDGFSLAIMRRH